MKKSKKDHFANLDKKSVTDSKKFWKTVKPLFSKKVKAKTVIKLVENDVMIEDESEIAKNFNEYFVNIVKNVGILTEEQTTYSATNQLREVEIAIIKYKNHPSINAITVRMEKLGKTTFYISAILFHISYIIILICFHAVETPKNVDFAG